MSELSKRPIRQLLGVGNSWASLLQRDAEISTYDDLVSYFPYKYIDRSRVYQVRDLRADMPYVQFIGRFVSMQMQGVGTKQRLVALFTDGTGSVEIVWFKSINYIRQIVNTHDEYLIFGKPNAFSSRINLVHPEMERIGDQGIKTNALQATYNTSERMKQASLNSRNIAKLVENLFREIGGPSGIVETFPAWLVRKLNLMLRGEAIYTLHFPKDTPSLERARYRMKFEELFYIQLKLLLRRNATRTKVRGFIFEHSGDVLADFYNNHLPFEPTNAQKRVVREIRADLGSGKQMNRLVQGDVGSGKTLVALMAMLIAVGNGYQACLMAPTEILAAQHYESLSQMLSGMNVNIALLTGSTKQKSRKPLLAALASGELNIVVGTHALIEDTVVFNRLGLAVVDEQHRFGVAQRARLWGKTQSPPHILVMTATPIPRTLAMTVYGDLDVSVIDEMPPGRKPVLTEHFFHNRRNELNRFIRKQLAAGRQVYVVYPLIEESEKLDFKNLNEGYEYMCDSFKEYEVCMVHGRMKPDEKDEAMRRFASGEAHILVATTVIEVGVNVPNASVMIIESAERFGLSQLHQLRGRVGRGSDQSYCILMTDVKLSDDTRRRMEVMTSTTDGFVIAEADLKMRGPGNIDGTQQSGLPFALKIADLARDTQIVQYSRDVAKQLLTQDPLLQQPENGIFLRRLAQLDGNTLDWSMIS